jgi:hypothetical protein
MTPSDFAFRVECWMLSFFSSCIPATRPSALLYRALIRMLWLLPDLTERRLA